MKVGEGVGYRQGSEHLPDTRKNSECWWAELRVMVMVDLGGGGPLDPVLGNTKYSVIVMDEVWESGPG